MGYPLTSLPTSHIQSSLLPNLSGLKNIWLTNFIGCSDLKSNISLLEKLKNEVRKCRKVEESNA